MIAFHGKQKIKDTYLNRIIAHQESDEIVKGHYWENGKGCAIGCTIHGNEHKRYETELGIPEWLARLEDRIFEGLPNARAKVWPREFLESIKPGQDLEKIKIPMLIFIVELAREKFDRDKYPRQLKAIDDVLFELKRPVIDRGKIREARVAAYAAASDAASDAISAAAYNAAAVAAISADAAYAAYNAASDAVAAISADAAISAAAYNAYTKFADKCLELIKEYA